MKRNIHLGNTEEQYRFCSEEILYIATGEKEGYITAVLLNNNQYTIPSTLTRASKCIYDLHSDGELLLAGKRYIINMKYLRSVSSQSVCLKAPAGVGCSEATLHLSSKACAKLTGREFEMIRSLDSFGFLAGYMTDSGDYNPCNLKESFFDIDDDDIMFLGG